MNKKIILIVGLFAMLMLSSVYATTDTIGATTSVDYGGAGYQIVQPVMASSSGVLSTIGVNIYQAGTGDNISVAIYSDNGGNPHTLLGYSPSIVVHSGWNDLSIAGFVSISAGTTYWLGFVSSTGVATKYYIATSGTQQFSNVQSSFSTWINPFVENFPYAETINMRMNYSIPISSSTTTMQSSTTTTITTTIPRNNTSLITALKVNGLPQLLAYTLALPYFAVGVVLLGLGLGWVLSKNMRTGLMAGFLVSVVMLFISVSLIGIGLVIVLFSFMVISSYLDIHSRRRG